jgi:hypothetical protein
MPLHHPGYSARAVLWLLLLVAVESATGTEELKPERKILRSEKTINEIASRKTPKQNGN